MKGFIITNLLEIGSEMVELVSIQLKVLLHARDIGVALPDTSA